jgi:hypothetical protein
VIHSGFKVNNRRKSTIFYDVLYHLNAIFLQCVYEGLDQGIKFCSKIQSAQNHFKLNESVGLVVANPTQLIWVQTDIGSKRYHVLFKMANRQKKGC